MMAFLVCIHDFQTSESGAFVCPLRHVTLAWNHHTARPATAFDVLGAGLHSILAGAHTIDTFDCAAIAICCTSLAEILTGNGVAACKRRGCGQGHDDRRQVERLLADAAKKHASCCKRWVGAPPSTDFLFP